ncbi:hypothetical protein B1759_08745 [Rubrivirga sp. SAORIC476]|uniref:Imm49 family immunity protein n=1 Tax=Rubrivirga sp. SAORIC476 TaxID=1961794 RepID=UPI000BA90274|nr:Imm49 family immunity protein [Rubrivirga sp. SAORIC476]PAP81399.1 hypothetical protein B1759_08745 [Rubrivirga sp. SAORIC476]
METLEDVYDALLSDTRMAVGGAVSGPGPEDLGSVAEEIQDAFEGLALCNLLVRYDAHKYREDLVHSARARIWFLEQCAREGLDAPERAVSRTPALFAALCARHDALAADLVASGPGAWIPEGEYEDDFCYVGFLSHAFADAAAEAGLPAPAALVERYERVANGARDPRLDVCRAFQARDESAFRDAFEGVLDAHTAWVAALTPDRLSDPVFRVRQHVSIEAIALLHLAERVGWSLEEDYVYCPRPARLGPTDAWPDDLFRQIDRLAAEYRRSHPPS